MQIRKPSSLKWKPEYFRKVHHWVILKHFLIMGKQSLGKMSKGYINISTNCDSISIAISQPQQAFGGQGLKE